MKKCLIVLLMIVANLAMTQVPQGINYQAVARDADGVILDGVSGDVVISILDTLNGNVIYSEKHQVTTNQFGLFTLVIGKGTPLTGNFSSIVWAVGSKFLKVEGDFGSGMEDFGTTQLFSVPFALHARTAASGQPGKNSLIRLNQFTGNTNCPNGGTYFYVGVDANGNSFLDNNEITDSTFICKTDTSGGGNDNDWIVDSNGDMYPANINSNVAIGFNTPLHKLDVLSLTDTVIASFGGFNPFATGIQIHAFNGNASSALLLTNGNPDTAIISLDPNDDALIVANLDSDGKTEVLADSAVYVGANKAIGMQSEKMYISVDSTIVIGNNNASTTWYNQGIFATDSLYVYGNNMFNSGYVLTNTGFGKAQWVDPNSLVSTPAQIWQQNGSDIYYNAGNVGVGTSSPSAPFTVVGSNSLFRDVTDNYSIAEITYTGSGSSSSGSLALKRNNINQVYFTANGSSWINSGNVGIGTNAPQSKLHVATPSSAITNVFQFGNGNQPTLEWFFDVDGTSLFTINNEGIGTPVMTMDPTLGYVGIGTSSSPTARLELLTDNNNTIRFTGFFEASMYHPNNGFQLIADYLSFKTTTPIGNISFFTNNNISTPRLQIVPSGNVGVNTSAPSEKFHVNGTLRLENLDANPIDTGAVLTAIDQLGNAVWKPRRIAFEANFLNLAGTTPLNNSSKIPFDAVALNTGNGFSTTSNDFTAPVDGVYHFSVVLTIENASLTSVYHQQIDLRVNNITVKAVTQTLNSVYGKGTISFDIDMNLSAGDVVDVYIQNTDPAYISLNNIGSWFSGHLVYAY